MFAWLAWWAVEMSLPRRIMSLVACRFHCVGPNRFQICRFLREAAFDTEIRTATLRIVVEGIKKRTASFVVLRQP
jgi:hypothetical protein